MKIKTVGDLRDIIEGLDDDFTIDFRIRTPIPKSELINRVYPYPFDVECRDFFEFDDVGYSDKNLCLGVTLGEVGSYDLLRPAELDSLVGFVEDAIDMHQGKSEYYERLKTKLEMLRDKLLMESDGNSGED